MWRYISRESIPVVPLYFAAERLVVERNGQLIMLDDERLKLLPGEEAKRLQVRFRTLGCYPLTAGVLSTASTVAEIIEELEQVSMSERCGRLIDFDQSGSMERKKQEGYF